MATPSVTLRSIKNTDTGIDITVPRFQEEEAPLGGVSILYEIHVQTTLELFKTRLHRSEDVVQFSIFKAYREIEDLSNKLHKKYLKAGLPRVPNSTSADKYTNEEKTEALNIFMTAIAKNIELCHSSLFTQFIGINSQKLPSFSIPSSQNENTESTEPDESEELFQKMKKPEKKVTPKPAEPVLKVVKSLDLFEEVGSKTTATNKSSSKLLFDDFEDDDLFTTKKVEKKPVHPKQKVEVKKSEKFSPKEKPAKPTLDEIDDSEIIIKNRKMGEVSLFEEQDFGDYITKDEEALFMVTAPPKSNKKNELLSPKNEILSPEKDLEVNEDLDELLNMNPLPLSPTELPAPSSAKENETIAAAKPIPLPRKKSLTKNEVEEKPSKPEVMPRKVFLNKNEDLPKPSPPSIPPKPVPAAGKAKPKPPVKPKPPPKKSNIAKSNATENATNLDIENANKTETNGNNSSLTTSILSDQLKDLDILQYIEQEQKSLDSNLSLFD